MQIVKSKMHKRTSFMSDIGSKVFANDYIPSTSILLINLSFYDSCNFTKLLSFEGIGKISNLFDSSVGNTNDGTFSLWIEIGHFDKNLFKILIVLIILVLMLVGIFVIIFVFIIDRTETVFILLFANNVLVLIFGHCFYKD